jgi:hypothetical protein
MPIARKWAWNSSNSVIVGTSFQSRIAIRGRARPPLNSRHASSSAGDAVPGRERRDLVRARELAHGGHFEEHVAQRVAVRRAGRRFGVVFGEA